MTPKAQRRRDRFLSLRWSLPKLQLAGLVVEMAVISIAAGAAISLLAFQWLARDAAWQDWAAAMVLAMGAAWGMGELIVRWYFQRLDGILGLEDV
jgi:hypothetical protein